MSKDSALQKLQDEMKRQEHEADEILQASLKKLAKRIDKRVNERLNTIVNDTNRKLIGLPIWLAGSFLAGLIFASAIWGLAIWTISDCHKQPDGTVWCRIIGD